MHVIKISGKLCTDPTTLAAIATAKPDIVVHGGGIQLDEALQPLGPTRKRRGQRITSPEAATVTAQVMDSIGHEITSQLQAHGLEATHVNSSQGALEASVMATDLGRVGKPVNVDLIRDNLTHTQVVTPVGWDKYGPLNVNADVGAAAIATASNAQHLHLVTDVPGLLDETGAFIPSLNLERAQQALDAGFVVGGMIPKLQSAMQAIRDGVEQVTIGSIHEGTVVHA